MRNPILRTAVRALQPLLLFFSIFLFLRGHNEPGGGFAGGLVGAAAFVVQAVAYDPAATRQSLRLDPRTFAAVGLCIAAASGLVGPLTGAPLLTAAWVVVSVGGREVHLGTPLVFDLGVYMVVVGVALSMVLGFLED